MGQRLNIEICDNDKVLANCYYHWSGFSLSSLNLTQKIIDYINNNDIAIDVKGAISCLMSTGANFVGEEFIEAKKLGYVEDDSIGKADRNNGLIGVTEKAIEETRNWEEGRVSINIMKKTVHFKCFNYCDMLTYYDDIWERIKDLFFEIKNLDSLIDVPFEKINILSEGIKEAEENYNGKFYGEYFCGISIY